MFHPGIGDRILSYCSLLFIAFTKDYVALTKVYYWVPRMLMHLPCRGTLVAKTYLY